MLASGRDRRNRRLGATVATGTRARTQKQVPGCDRRCRRQGATAGAGVRERTQEPVPGSDRATPPRRDAGAGRGRRKAAQVRPRAAPG
ncbi:MAG: hypothetical protein LBT40_18340 [Deltaproteobacteria bacterium]|nr:hypothetical protein [Deltaproteobacteria bacterium]